MKTVLSIGIFDLFNRNHIEFLKKARSYGDYLIVVLGSDERTKFLKGENRPFIKMPERLSMLHYNTLVDAVYIAKTPGHLNPAEEALEAIKPDVYAVDTNKDSGDFPAENKICIKLGIRVEHIGRYNPDESTSKILSKLNR